LLVFKEISEDATRHLQKAPCFSEEAAMRRRKSLKFGTGHGRKWVGVGGLGRNGE
jgi:hypothetical protein